MDKDYIHSISNKELFRLIKEKFGIEVKDENDIQGALQVAEKMNLLISYQLVQNHDGTKWLVTYLHKDFDDTEECWLETLVSADTAPLAIYRAALMAVEARDE